jgi:hypothetical protein
VSPHRGDTFQQIQAIRTQENRLADAVPRPDAKPNPASTPAGMGIWPQAPLGTRAIEAPAARQAFGIYGVNGRTKGIHLTPGVKVVLTGLGLGEPASVRLVGGTLDAHPVLLRIVWRAPTRIDAEIPSEARGSPDEPNASVEVRTANGTTYRFDGVSFIAEREETTITDPHQIAQFVEWIVTNSQWGKGIGQIGRAAMEFGKSIDCPQPGTDTIHFRVYRGFEAVGASMVSGRTDSGDGDENGWAGSRVFTPGYSFGDWTKEELQVNWGVFRSHTSPRTYAGFEGMRLVDDPWTALVLLQGDVPIDRTSAWDICRADWALTALTVSGPAGMTP